MAKKKRDDRPDPQEMNYEDAVAELELINQRIEQGDIGLEESLEEYRRGMALAKRCNNILETAEQEVKKIKPSGGAGDEKSRNAASSDE
jgi:exodeoxyribonuclease VII small subunit